MRIRHLVPALLVVGSIACDSDSVLDLDPTTSVPEEQAIVDAATARAALAGAYNALQDTDQGYYYAETFVDFGDLLTDNTEHSGTFTSYLDADANDVTADNGAVEGMWDNIYEAINRANVLLEKLPTVPGLADAERTNMLGQAYFLRALHYHNLVKHWGGNSDLGVPLRLAPVKDIIEASNITRASRSDVYTQIVGDLQEAERLLANAPDDTRRASLRAVKAIQARVHLYRRDWAAAVTAADAVLAGHSLAPEYADLFTAEGSDTPEDIFRIVYNAQERNYLGYYYLSDTFGGRYEVAPTTNLFNAYEAGDERRGVTIAVDGAGNLFGVKYPSGAGTEHVHVIRLAEVMLIKAEALAMQDLLGQAVDAYNPIRTRAGLQAHILGITVPNTRQGVLDAIWKERRLELALEGDRLADLVRSDRFVQVMGLPATRAFQALYPIPQNEIDVTRGPDGQPRLTQNPGY
ncbi:MAG: RagB/SusD family nutrient uptake outer membrane protein [Gemmatimonadaceae bacterium]